MTREEVRRQLEKNPLRWLSTRYWWAVTDHCASLVEISRDASSFFVISEEFEDDGKRLNLKLADCLALKANDYDKRAIRT